MGRVRVRSVVTRELVHLTERQVRRGDGGKNSRPRQPTRRRCDGSERWRSGMGVCVAGPNVREDGEEPRPPVPLVGKDPRCALATASYRVPSRCREETENDEKDITLDLFLKYLD